MEEIYANVEHVKSVASRPSTNQTGPRSSERRFHGAVVLCLGLLSVFLLAGLIGLGVHYYDVVRGLTEELSITKANLTEERDLLSVSLNETTKELHRLQKQNSDVIHGLTKERDLLNANLTETTKELQRLQSLSKQKRTCPAGWKMFGCSCYLLSSRSGSWSTGRQDCRERGADLVIIDSPKEQEFFSTFTKKETFTWIGLTDIDTEGTWKWIDGTPLTLSYWETGEPNNGGQNHGEEDCAHMRTGKKTVENWNDVSCGTSLQWICEKNVDV